MGLGFTRDDMRWERSGLGLFAPFFCLGSEQWQPMKLLGGLEGISTLESRHFQIEVLFMGMMYGVRYRPGSGLSEELGIEVPNTVPRDPSKVYCSFCQGPEDPTFATEGRGPLRKKVEQIPLRSPVSGDIVGFEEKVSFSSSRLTACRKCCLNLVGRTKFRETAG